LSPSAANGKGVAFFPLRRGLVPICRRLFPLIPQAVWRGGLFVKIVQNGNPTLEGTGLRAISLLFLLLFLENSTWADKNPLFADKNTTLADFNERTRETEKEKDGK